MRRVKARAALCLLLACALLLGAPCAWAEYRELREGMRGSDVLALKTAMYYLGYFTSLNLSDSYNAVMTQRVKNLQKANDLPQTGQAGQTGESGKKGDTVGLCPCDQVDDACRRLVRWIEPEQQCKGVARQADVGRFRRVPKEVPRRIVESFAKRPLQRSGLPIRGKL